VTWHRRGHLSWRWKRAPSVPANAVLPVVSVTTNLFEAIVSPPFRAVAPVTVVAPVTLRVPAIAVLPFLSFFTE